MIWPRIKFDKKPFDIFSPQIERKRSKEYLFIYSFGCKKKALSDFLASSSCGKIANIGKPA